MSVWDVSQFNQPEICDYYTSISDLPRANTLTRDAKEQFVLTKRLPDELKFLQTLPSDKSKILKFMLLKNTNISVLLYNYKIVVFDFEEFTKIEDFTQQKFKYLSIFIDGANEFKDIQSASLHEFDSLLIQDIVK